MKSGTPKEETLRHFKVRGWIYDSAHDDRYPFEQIIPAKNRNEAAKKFWMSRQQQPRPIPKWGLFEIASVVQSADTSDLKSDS
jgi:hypothetical protein